MGKKILKDPLINQRVLKFVGLGLALLVVLAGAADLLTGPQQPAGDFDEVSIAE